MSFPEFASQLLRPCTKSILKEMLRNRGYRLDDTQYKKDKGLIRVYMLDPWADPMSFKIGEYWEHGDPDWAVMYDCAMQRHLENKEVGRDRTDDDN